MSDTGKLTVTAADDEPDDSQYVIETRINKTKPARSEATDEFAKPVAQLRTMNGLGTAFKRNATRTMNKVLEGDGGAKSTRVDIPATGYSLFKVVSPPYNLDYLAA